MSLLHQLRAQWRNSPTIRNLLKVSFGDAASKLINVLITFLLIRGLSVTDYAHYITFSGLSYLFSGIVGVGINMALIRYTADSLSKGKEKPLQLYVFALVLQLSIYILVAGILLSFPSQSTTLLFGRPALEVPLRLGLLAGLGVLIIQFVRTLYQAEEKFNPYIGTLWMVQILIFLCLAVTWLLGFLAFGPVATIFTAVQLLIGLVVLMRYLGNHTLVRVNEALVQQKESWKSLMRGSAWLIGYFLFLNLFSRTDILMLFRFRGEEEVAVYGVAFQYYSLALLFLGSIHAVLLPKFSREEMQQPERQRAFLKQWLQANIWLLPPILVFDLLGRPIFVWLNGAQYERSFPIFIVFSMGIWLSMMFSPLVNILIGRGEYRFLFVLGLLALFFNIGCNALLVPWLGGVGAALVVILTQNVFIQLPILFKGLKYT